MFEGFEIAQIFELGVKADCYFRAKKCVDKLTGLIIPNKESFRESSPEGASVID